VFDVDAKHVSFDTTSVSVQGEYDLYDTEKHGHPFKITYGHSKNYRLDLKQFMISLLCVDRTVPIFGRTEDGNGSDKTINKPFFQIFPDTWPTKGLNRGPSSTLPIRHGNGKEFIYDRRSYPFYQQASGNL